MYRIRDRCESGVHTRSGYSKSGPGLLHSAGSGCLTIDGDSHQVHQRSPREVPLGDERIGDHFAHRRISLQARGQEEVKGPSTASCTAASPPNDAPPFQPTQSSDGSRARSVAHSVAYGYRNMPECTVNGAFCGSPPLSSGKASGNTPVYIEGILTAYFARLNVARLA
jgi:hypothetical protein